MRQRSLGIINMAIGVSTILMAIYLAIWGLASNLPSENTLTLAFGIIFFGLICIGYGLLQYRR